MRSVKPKFIKKLEVYEITQNGRKLVKDIKMHIYVERDGIPGGDFNSLYSDVINREILSRYNEDDTLEIIAYEKGYPDETELQPCLKIIHEANSGLSRDLEHISGSYMFELR